MRRFASFLSLVVFLAFCSCGEKEKGSQALITTGSLVEEMVDLVKLASFPAPRFRTVQFSSYDRRSSLPGGKGGGSLLGRAKSL